MAGNIKFDYKPSGYGSSYQDLYTTKPEGGGGGGKGGGGGRNNQNGGNFSGNGNGKDLKFRNGGGGDRNRFQMANMVGGGRDVFGMETAPPPETMQRDMMRQQVDGLPDQTQAQPDILRRNGNLNMGSLQDMIAGQLPPDLFQNFKNGTPYTPDAQAAAMLSRGNENGGQLSKEQQQAKAMMYGNYYDPNFALNQWRAKNGMEAATGVDSKDRMHTLPRSMGGMGKVDNSMTLSVDDYGGMARGDGKNDLNAQRLINMMERGKIPYPKGYTPPR